MEILLALLLIIGGVVLIIKYRSPAPPPPPEIPNPPVSPNQKTNYVTIYKFSQDKSKTRCSTCDAENVISSVYCCVCGNRVKG